jgi:single-strand DNA-binding protein
MSVVAKDVNVIVLTGRLVDDVKLTYQGESKFPIAKFRIANNVGNNGYSHTNFINVKCIGKTAENAAKYLSKGRSVQITGEFQIISGKDEKDEWWSYPLVNVNQLTYLGTSNSVNEKTTSEGMKTNPNVFPVKPKKKVAEQLSFDGFNDSPQSSVEEDIPDTIPPSPFYSPVSQMKNMDDELEELPF